MQGFQLITLNKCCGSSSSNHSIKSQRAKLSSSPQVSHMSGLKRARPREEKKVKDGMWLKDIFWSDIQLSIQTPSEVSISNILARFCEQNNAKIKTSQKNEIYGITCILSLRHHYIYVIASLSDICGLLCFGNMSIGNLSSVCGKSQNCKTRTLFGRKMKSVGKDEYKSWSFWGVFLFFNRRRCIWVLGEFFTS